MINDIEFLGSYLEYDHYDEFIYELGLCKSLYLEDVDYNGFDYPKEWYMRVRHDKRIDDPYYKLFFRKYKLEREPE